MSRKKKPRIDFETIVVEVSEQYSKLSVPELIDERKILKEKLTKLTIELKNPKTYYKRKNFLESKRQMLTRLLGRSKEQIKLANKHANVQTTSELEAFRDIIKKQVSVEKFIMLSDQANELVIINKLQEKFRIE